MNRGINIRTDLTPGDHILRCEVLEATADPGGGHEFRIISVMRYVLLPPVFFSPSIYLYTSSPFISPANSKKRADIVVCNGLSVYPVSWHIFRNTFRWAGVYNLQKRQLNVHVYTEVNVGVSCSYVLRTCKCGPSGELRILKRSVRSR